MKASNTALRAPVLVPRRLLVRSASVAAALVILFRVTSLYLALKRGKFVFPQKGPLTLVRRTLIEIMVRSVILAGEAHVAITRPRLVKSLAHIYFSSSRVISNLRYGSKDRQHLDVFTPVAPTGETRQFGVMLLVHGGAWSWGHKWHYGPWCEAVSQSGILVCAMNYRTYPRANVDGMIDDVRLAVEWIVANIAPLGGNPLNIHLVGHSSGAHLSMMTALGIACDHSDLHRNIKSVIGMSGVYDIDDHFLHEAGRSMGPLKGVAHISPMAPANGHAVSAFDSRSAPKWVSKLTAPQRERMALVTLIHGDADEVVPISSSEKLHAQLTTAGLKSQVHVMKSADHTAPIMDIVSPGAGRMRLITLFMDIVEAGDIRSKHQDIAPSAPLTSAWDLVKPRLTSHSNPGVTVVVPVVPVVPVRLT